VALPNRSLVVGDVIVTFPEPNNYGIAPITSVLSQCCGILTTKVDYSMDRVSAAKWQWHPVSDGLWASSVLTDSMR
jgi:hypothetical protein